MTIEPEFTLSRVGGIESKLIDPLLATHLKIGVKIT